MEHQKMTAREYYYSVIDPEEKGRNYASHYSQGTKDQMQWMIKNKDVYNFIVNHVPVFSNDALLEGYTRKFIESNDNEIGKRLENVFVVKEHSFFQTAFAIGNRKMYSGDLVVFFVGLSDACTQYALLYSHFIETMNLLINRGDNDKLVDKEMRTLHIILRKLALAQERWIVNDDYIKLEKGLNIADDISEDVANSGYAFASDTDEFILGHEMAHHLLGHTGNEVTGQKFIDALPLSCQLWNNDFSKRANELKADAMSLLLITGALGKHGKQVANSQDYAVKYAVSSFLTLTVLGQLEQDVNKESSTHPCIKKRFIQCAMILANLFSKELMLKLLPAIFDFQLILNESQGRGFTKKNHEEILDALYSFRV